MYGDIVCEDFAKLLLNKDHLTVKALLDDSKGDNKRFIRSVFDEWLDKSDKDESAVPRTWESLAQCVRRTPGLPGTLADYLDDLAKFYNNPS